MNALLYLVSFSFSFFFILISYWKEDKNLNVIGSISLMIVTLILVGTSIQLTNYVPVNQVTISNATGNYTSLSYEPRNYNYGVFLESMGIGFFMSIFIILQYLYFHLSHQLAKES
jgi:hypothetical protein